MSKKEFLDKIELLKKNKNNEKFNLWNLGFSDNYKNLSKFIPDNIFNSFEFLFSSNENIFNENLNKITLFAYHDSYEIDPGGAEITLLFIDLLKEEEVFFKYKLIEVLVEVLSGFYSYLFFCDSDYYYFMLSLFHDNTLFRWYKDEKSVDQVNFIKDFNRMFFKDKIQRFDYTEDIKYSLCYLYPIIEPYLYFLKQYDEIVKIVNSENKLNSKYAIFFTSFFC
jgi:hypothetical protein